MRRWGWVLFAVLLSPSWGIPQDNESVFQKTVLPFFKAHCLRCHSPEKKKGKFDVSPLGPDVGTSRTGYAAILERLLAGDMPPEEEPRPDARAVRAVVEW